MCDVSWTSRLIPVGVALAGIALVIWQVQSVGLDAVVQGFKEVGPTGFALVLGLSFLGEGLEAWLSGPQERAG